MDVQARMDAEMSALLNRMNAARHQAWGSVKDAVAVRDSSIHNFSCQLMTFWDVFQNAQCWDLRHSALVQELQKASDDFILADIKSFGSFAHHWTKFLESFALSSIIEAYTTYFCRLPKRNKKEYTGSARAEKEALNAQKLAMAQEFYAQYYNKYCQLQAAFRASSVQVANVITSFRFGMMIDANKS